MNITKNIVQALALMIVLALSSCDDYLEIKPVGEVIPETVDDYRQMLTAAYNISTSHKYLSAYRTDELVIEPTSLGVEQYADIYTWNDETPAPETLEFPYQDFYAIIFYCNEIINNKSIVGQTDLISQLQGEAYALRAYQYLELINLYAQPYGDVNPETADAVPLVLEYDSERTYPKATMKVVYDQILSDITQAKSLINIEQQKLGYNYRFSKLALLTLESYVHLYMENWEAALDAANSALEIHDELQDLNTDQSTLPSEYNSVESILALDIVSSFDIANYATVEDKLFNSYGKGDLRSKILFTEDKKGAHFVKTANNKYKCSFRVSDLYLIKTEAQTHLLNIESAKKTLLKFLENRYNTEFYNKLVSDINLYKDVELLKFISSERYKEFALEGKRWIDLRRNEKPLITKTYNDAEYILEEGDVRYTLPFPNSARINNPYL